MDKHMREFGMAGLGRASVLTLALTLMLGGALAVMTGCGSGRSSRATADSGLSYGLPDADDELGGEGRYGEGAEIALPGMRPVHADGPRVAIPELQTIYFGFDEVELDADARATLDRNANWLLANEGKVIEIEGHCDERGSEQYNLGLGERRANEVRSYLVNRGVNPDRLFTRSFGEMRPQVLNAKTESEHRMNRRAEFKEIVQRSL